MRPNTSLGLICSSTSGPSPSRSITPGRKPSISASALATRRLTTSLPAWVLTSTAIERRPRCSTSNFGSRPGMPRSVASRRSTRITSAPMSANSMAANGAGPMPAISMMRKPARGPIMVTFPFLPYAPIKQLPGNSGLPGPRVYACGKRFSMPAWLHARKGVNDNRACVKRVQSRNPSGPAERLAADIERFCGRTRAFASGAHARAQSRSWPRVRALRAHRRAPGAEAGGTQGPAVADPRERSALSRPARQSGGRHPAPRCRGTAHVRQPGVLPRVRARAGGGAGTALPPARVCRRRGSARWPRARRSGISATCRRSKRRQARAGSSGRSTRCPPAKARWPRCSPSGAISRKRAASRRSSPMRAGRPRPPTAPSRASSPP